MAQAGDKETIGIIDGLPAVVPGATPRPEETTARHREVSPMHVGPNQADLLPESPVLPDTKHQAGGGLATDPMTPNPGC